MVSISLANYHLTFQITNPWFQIKNKSQLGSRLDGKQTVVVSAEASRDLTRSVQALWSPSGAKHKATLAGWLSCYRVPCYM